MKTTTAPAYTGIAKTGYTALIAMLEAIDAAAADASHDGGRMVTFTIGRGTFTVRQTFKRLAHFKKHAMRYRTAFADKAIAKPTPVAVSPAPTIQPAPQVATVRPEPAEGRPSRTRQSPRRNPLDALLGAVHDAHLASREALRCARHHIATA